MRIKFSIALLVFMSLGCKKVSESFEEEENAVVYTASSLTNNPYPTSEIKLMSWNIRFGIGREDWFGDACGLNTIYDADLVTQKMSGIVGQINSANPDILMVQECDINSKRTSYVNEINYILDHTSFNYAYYGPVWQSQFIPSHGLGKMDMGIVIFSKWEIENVKRLSLPDRTDQGSAENYFYLKYCMLKGDLKIPGFKKVVLFNVHSVAFATDDTKKKHYEKVKSELDKVNNVGDYFVVGADFNTLPPNATKKDYCIEDICSGEVFHNPSQSPEHKEGSNYTGEGDWINILYNSYTPSLSLSKYISNESSYFTYAPNHPNGLHDRRLDYFFTNYNWVNNSDSTYQNAISLSDHAPISVKLILPQ